MSRCVKSGSSSGLRSGSGRRCVCLQVQAHEEAGYSLPLSGRAYFHWWRQNFCPSSHQEASLGFSAFPILRSAHSISCSASGIKSSFYLAHSIFSCSCFSFLLFRLAQSTDIVVLLAIGARREHALNAWPISTTPCIAFFAAFSTNSYLRR